MAGHGVLDESGNYHFAPYGFSPQDIAGTGISYDTILDMFGNIPARRRLLMLDTCHAGEVIDVAAAVPGDLPPGVRVIQDHRGLKKLQATAPQRGIPQWGLGELCATSASGTGVQVLTASAGTEFAFETEQAQNGLFTHAVIQGLRTRAADLNGDQQIRTSELIRHVQ